MNFVADYPYLEHLPIACRPCLLAYIARAGIDMAMARTSASFFGYETCLAVS